MASNTVPAGSAPHIIGSTTSMNNHLSSSLNNLSLRNPPDMTTAHTSTSSMTPDDADARTNLEDLGNSAGGPPVNNGTGAHFDYRPIEEESEYGEHLRIMTLQTITRDPRFSDFSLEELRVADYAQGRRQRGSGIKSSGFSQRSPFLLSNRAAALHMLKGSSIEVIVGSKTGIFGKQETWCLPSGLISYHSLFFEAACSRDFKEKEENRILLEHEDPRVFSLFVEWMYYDEYSLSSSCMFNSDLKAWVLGDKLMSTTFKNHAMARLYDAHHIDNLAPLSVTPDMVSFICNNTCEGAKLRQFYIGFVVTHFSNPYKVLGTIEEWDSVMVDFDDIRMALFTAMRSSDQLDRVEELECYLEETAARTPHN